MSGLITGMILYICIVPTTLIMYFLLYPKNWRSKKRIYGVNNRAEFKTDKSGEYIDSLVSVHNRQAGVITIGVIVVATALLFVPGLTAKTMSMTVLVLVALFAIMVPYALGNSQLKKYKKVLGLVCEKVLYADLKTAGNIHALSKPMIYAADLAGILILALALLCDTGVLPVNMGVYSGTFICTAMAGSLIAVSLIMLPIAFIVDNSRNEVISENSDINANYNRSRKKIYADYFITVSWIDNAFALIMILSLVFLRQEIVTLVILGICLLAIMAATALFAKKSIAHSRRYMTEEADLVEDDDDYWILGMFYYNPKDRHLNISKRAGIGSTVNIAHPAGKVITGIGILAIIAALMTLVWVGMMG
ncbi:MAG: hypothetical protein IK152_07855 [Lachnospiraceae bacterium]|nr:hypothetical protein [Lachnospiraceae bacterium]